MLLFKNEALPRINSFRDTEPDIVNLLPSDGLFCTDSLYENNVVSSKPWLMSTDLRLRIREDAIDKRLRTGGVTGHWCG